MLWMPSTCFDTRFPPGTSEPYSKRFRSLLEELKRVLGTVTDPRGRSVAESLVMTLTRMIEIGLPYLSLNREAATLSGGAPP